MRNTCRGELWEPALRKEHQDGITGDAETIFIARWSHIKPWRQKRPKGFG